MLHIKTSTFLCLLEAPDTGAATVDKIKSRPEGCYASEGHFAVLSGLNYRKFTMV